MLLKIMWPLDTFYVSRWSMRILSSRRGHLEYDYGGTKSCSIDISDEKFMELIAAGQKNGYIDLTEYQV